MCEAVAPASAAPYVPHIDEYGRKSQAPFLTPEALGLKDAAPDAGLSEERIREIAADWANSISDDQRRDGWIIEQAIRQALQESRSEREVKEPVAWLYKCSKGGLYSEYASVDHDDTQWWPRDQWRQVTRTPLCECGPGEELLAARPGEGEKR